MTATLKGAMVASLAIGALACDLAHERDDALASVSLATTAGAPDDQGTLVVTRESSPPVRPAAAAIAVLRLQNGAVVEFIDVLDGRVAVAERAPRNERFRSTDLVRSWDATPLEIFLALAPRGALVPGALSVDHELHARASGASDAPPRDLSGSVSFGVGDPGVEEFACDGTGFNFAQAWYDEFDDVTTYAAVGSMHQIASTYTFYPGAPVYYGTNTNSVTYFGACNGDEVAPLTVEIHRRFKYIEPPTVVYQWLKVTDVVLDGLQKYTFYSGIPASYREVVKPPAGDVVEHAQAAAAWTLSPVLGPP
jgi:hypothetical protein